MTQKTKTNADTSLLLKRNICDRLRFLRHLSSFSYLYFFNASNKLSTAPAAVASLFRS